VADFIDLMVSQHNGTFDVWKTRVRNNLPKWNSNDSYLKKMFDIIVFDLDDTLVPVMGPIHEANQAVQTFVNNKMLKSAPTIDEHYASKVKTVAKEHPMVAHDYTEIRTIAMTELCEHHDDEIDLVKEAIEVRVIRYKVVDGNLYPDSRDVL
jgi:FMN phosphatase YigB (HAD superfamily)